MVFDLVAGGSSLQHVRRNRLKKRANERSMHAAAKHFNSSQAIATATGY
jgi:hypothetical protein